MGAIVTLSVAGIILLLPVQFLHLPLGVSLADIWGFVAMPMCWAYLFKLRHPFRLHYLSAMLVIALATSLSSLTSVDPLHGMVVLLREFYLYIWFATLAAMFAVVDDATLRKLLIAWVCATLGNGLIVVAQFVHPSLLETMNASVAGLGNFDEHRPSGLLANTNAAGVFQMMGFVPLVLLRLPQRHILPLGAIMFAMVLATGSMGAILAVCVGLFAALVVTATVLNNWKAAVQFTFRAGMGAASLLAILFLISTQSAAFRERMRYLLFARGTRSAESRFDIWNEGFEILMSQMRLWGIGPDHFKLHVGHEIHNDFLSFMVERGFLGLLGLGLFGLAAMMHAMRIVRERRADWSMVVFPAAVVAFFVEAQTHEIFHMRPIWLGLAIQEGMLMRSWRATGPATDDRPFRDAARSGLMPSQRPVIT